MKKQWEEVHQIENLEHAFYKAAKGKWNKPEVWNYSQNLQHNLNKLSDYIQEGTFPVGAYTYFTIYDPKERIICAADFSERVYHHAIMHVYHQYFEAFQIEDSYATRPKKGTHKALQRAYEFNLAGGYWIKMDIKKYFDLIHHTLLQDQLKNHIKDFDFLYNVNRIINSYSVTEKRGIPIGNLTSQYFANFYIGHLDRFIKKDLKVERYIRYMDDFIIWHRNKKTLWWIYNQIECFVTSVLKLKLKPLVSNTTSFDLPFLGFIITQKGIRPNKRNRVKYKKKIMMLGTSQESDKTKAQKFWCLQAFYTHQINKHA